MINKKLLSILITFALIAFSSATIQLFEVPQAYAANDPTATILVTGADGTSKSFTLTELEALPSSSMYGGFYQQNQKIGNNGLWTGVSVLSLCKEVGGITPDNTITVTGQGTNTFTYEMIYSGTDINSEYKTYNNLTNEPQEQTEPITVILAYRVNGTELPDSYQPAPRLIMVGPEGLLGEGSGGRGITQVTITNTPSATATPSPMQTATPTSPPTEQATTTPSTSPTATPENDENGDQTATYLIVTAGVAAVAIAVAAFMRARKK
jgi:hypothetical protein